MKRFTLVLAALVIAACHNSNSGSTPGQTQPQAVTQESGGTLLVTGAGSTFAAPLYTKWSYDYHQQHPKMEFNYQSIGSGGGIQQITSHTVDFGASDAWLTAEQLKNAPGLMNLPTVLGAVAITYNLPELKNVQLKFGPDTLSGIYLGQITRWNDPRLVQENPGVKLPDDAIVVTHRSEGSGTTAIFTDYLAKISPTWKQKVGSSTSVRWPVGLGGKGSEGVTGIVEQNPGAIGYVELSYATDNHLPVAAMKSHDGPYVVPSTASTSAAAAHVQMPDDFSVSITDAAGADAYPIAGFTYVLLYQNLTGSKALPLLKFWQWGLTEGEKAAAPLGYAPLPAAVDQKVLARLKQISVNGQPAQL